MYVRTSSLPLSVQTNLSIAPIAICSALVNVVHLTPLAFDLPSLEMLDLEKTAQTLLLETLPPL